MPLFLASIEEKFDVSPNEAPDGAIMAFSTPDTFDPDTLRFYRNGQRQTITCDYLLSESGGAGTGYDTITSIVAPKTWEILRFDYNIEYC